MKARLIALALLAAAPASLAHAGGPVAIARPELHAAASLQVSSTAFAPGGPIPMDQSGYGRNISPVLNWSAGPPGTKAYALLVEDPDAPGAEPTVHWLAYDIPADVRALPRGVRNQAELKRPEGMKQGANYHGSVGYSGPRPPAGDPPHHYHFQVFALDRPLKLRPGADRDAVLRAMRGHVLAAGELVGAFALPPPKPPRR